MAGERRFFRFPWRTWPQIDEDLDAEVQFHLDMRTQELIDQLMPPDAAGEEARRQFGSVDAMRRYCRRQDRRRERQSRWSAWLDDLSQDVSYAARRLVDARWFALAIVTTLALGMGANTLVFTLVNGVMLRDLPFDEPDRIVALWTRHESGRTADVSFQDLRDWDARARTLEGIAGSFGSVVNLGDEDRLPERIAGAYVTRNYFRTMGVQPVLGRDFSEEDDLPGAAPVVLLGYGVWQSRFGGDPAVLGLAVRFNGLAATVVGVMPEGMRFPYNNDIWIPRVNLPAYVSENRGDRAFAAVGRLAPGAPIEEAREDLHAIGARLAEAYPETNAGMLPELQPLRDDVPNGRTRRLYLSLMGAVAFVLLIACANAANLLLAQSAARSQEIAVRVSLGATRGRIVRQLVVESLIVAVLATLAGLGIAALGIHGFESATRNTGMPYWMEFAMDPAVFGFTALLCLGTALLFGLAPAMYLSRADVSAVLKEGARGGAGSVGARRWSGGLIMGEVALTIVLLSGAGLTMRSFLHAVGLDLGIETKGLLTMEVYLPLTKYPEPGQRIQVFDAFLDRLHDVSGIGSSALMSDVPVGGRSRPGVELDGRAEQPGEIPPTVSTVDVSEGYFDALGLPLLRGRAFTREDGEPGSEVAIVNQRFADLHLPEGEILGRRLRLLPRGRAADDVPWLTIVGVTPNVRQCCLREQEADPVVYVPLRLRGERALSLVVRADGDMATTTSLVRETMRAVEPDVPLFNAMSMDERLAEQRWQLRVYGTLFALFAVVAVVLAAVGIYSVTATSVAQRTREFGIRASLGAHPRAILWLVLRRVLLLLLIALPVGVAGAYGVERLLASVLVQTTPAQPLTLASVALVMAGVALAAGLWPARRAVRVDPMVALRPE
jgi:predicted permease